MGLLPQYALRFAGGSSPQREKTPARPTAVDADPNHSILGKRTYEDSFSREGRNDDSSSPSKMGPSDDGFERAAIARKEEQQQASEGGNDPSSWGEGQWKDLQSRVETAVKQKERMEKRRAQQYAQRKDPERSAQRFDQMKERWHDPTAQKKHSSTPAAYAKYLITERALSDKVEIQNEITALFPDERKFLQSKIQRILLENASVK